jgi:hypothetical protein
MTNEPRQSINDQLPTELEQPQDAGIGVSHDQADQLTPIVTTLQTNSPQCDVRGVDYVNGAEPGRFWLRNSDPPIREWLDVIPCGMLHTFTEWLQNRQGYVGRHGDLPNDTQITIDSSSGRRTYVRTSNKNVLEDTRELYLMIDGTLHMLPATGTKHTFVRALETFFHQQRNPKTGNVLPSFAHLLRLTTVPRSNSKGRWFDLKFETIRGDDGRRVWPSLAQYQQAKALTEGVERGLPLLASNPVAGIPGPKAA